MLPGKTYRPDDFLWMAWKRRWFIVVPALIIAAATFTWSYFLPNRYRAQATILVVPQRVPESYVRSTVTADLSERLTTIKEQILSRTRLERIIEEFNLYQEERRTLIMEDIVEQMRLRDVRVGLAPRRRGEDATSFTVGFESSNPRTAMQVAERLASMFVQENLQDREVLADSTTQFLQALLDDARRRLIEHEKKVEEFNRVNAGKLPSQAQSNMQMMQTTQARLQANADAQNRDRDRLALLEKAIEEAANAPPVAVPVPAGKDESGGTTAQQLEAARAGLRQLELRFTPEHPDIARAKRIIAGLEAKAEAEALTAAVSPEAASAASVAGRPTPAMTKLAADRREAAEIRARIEARKVEEKRLQEALAMYTSRLEASPSLESAMTELMRDYGTLQEQYTALLQKSEQSKIAVNLERRQIGEQFRIIDGARQPERPISPDRVRYNLFGLLAGLAAGLALVALLEYRDTTLKTDDDVAISLSLPVLAVIPTMITAQERRRMIRRRRLLAVSASLASLVVVAAVVAWRLRLIQSWVR